MSYGVIYRLTFENLFSESCQLNIEERDEAENITNLICKHSPIAITFDTPSNDILAPVNGSRALLRLISETTFQFRDLYTSDSRKYRVTLRIEYEIRWQGFIQPSQYMSRYKIAPNINEFVAMDQ